jgi:hypothetical protein
MDFTLFYRGPLKSNGDKTHKQDLRRHFHPQLKRLWNQEPLCHFKTFYEASGEQADTIARQVGRFRFVPLVCEGLHLVAKLHLTLLRPELPGSIITSGGDIDNRLKTLLDSLKIPSEPNALPPDALPDSDETPFFCLLEDDHLVTELTVTTAQLLESDLKNEVVLLLNVTTAKVATLLGGLELP